MIRRFGVSAFALLKALDILLCTIWLATLYPFGLSERPSGRHLVSSYVGEAAASGADWAMRVAAIIDRLAIWLGDDPEHCHRMFLKYRGLDG